MYLKLIDSLPFTSEGYSCAKAVLQAKFGNPTVAANAQINCIISLRKIFGSHPNQVHDFYEKCESSGVVVITTAQLHSTKPELRFCLGTNPPHGVSKIRDSEDL